MPDVPSLVLSELMLPEAIPYRSSYSWTVLMPVSLLIGALFVVFLNTMPYIHGGFDEHLEDQERILTMASALVPRLPKVPDSLLFVSRGSMAPGIHGTVASLSQGALATRLPGADVSWLPGYPVRRSQGSLSAHSDLVTEFESVHSGHLLSEFVTTRSGVKMPRLIYASLRREERDYNLIEEPVRDSVRAGFFGIHVGNTKYWHQEGVGLALNDLKKYAWYSRENFFIQSKVDPDDAAKKCSDMPYCSIKIQVKACFKDSLHKLGLDYVDTLLLGAPYPTHEQTMEAWQAMEDLMQEGLVRQLGIANVASPEELQRLHADARVKPDVVQLGFVNETWFDTPWFKGEMRRWWIENDVYLQGWWSVNANQHIVDNRIIRALAEMYDKSMQQPQWKEHRVVVTVPVLFLRFMMGMDVVPLTGTRSEDQWRLYLAAWTVPLTAIDSEIIAQELLSRPFVGLYTQELWSSKLKGFRTKGVDPPPGWTETNVVDEIWARRRMMGMSEDEISESRPKGFSTSGGGGIWTPAQRNKIYEMDSQGRNMITEEMKRS